LLAQLGELISSILLEARRSSDVAAGRDGNRARWYPNEIRGPAAIQSTHAEAIGQTGPALIIPTARLRRSPNTPQAGEVFDKICCDRNTFGRFGHPGGDLAGPSDILRGEDGAQVRDQRSSVVAEKRRPDLLIGQRPEDQRGDFSAQSRGQGARATVVDNGGRRERSPRNAPLPQP
jgi:hypothetical protein